MQRTSRVRSCVEPDCGGSARIESEAKAVNSDLDKGIRATWMRLLIVEKLHEHVKYSVRNNVVTLTGEVSIPNRSEPGHKRVRGGS